MYSLCTIKKCPKELKTFFPKNKYVISDSILKKIHSLITMKELSGLQIEVNEHYRYPEIKAHQPREPINISDNPDLRKKQKYYSYMNIHLLKKYIHKHFNKMKYCRLLNFDGGFHPHIDIPSNVLDPGTHLLKYIHKIQSNIDTSYIPKFHGTANMGVLYAIKNNIGIDGLLPAQKKSLIRFEKEDYSLLIRRLKRLSPGDVILIELEDDSGYPIEKSPIIREIIGEAVCRFKVHVVIPAGNSEKNQKGYKLEDKLLGYNDTGSIVVGAAYNRPYSINHGCINKNYNYGDRVSLYCYGEKITTTSINVKGYFDYFIMTDDKKHCFTTGYKGTSSAAAIIAGCVTLLSSCIRAHGRVNAISPDKMRQILIRSAQENVENKKAAIPDMIKAVKILQKEKLLP